MGIWDNAVLTILVSWCVCSSVSLAVAESQNVYFTSSNVTFLGNPAFSLMQLFGINEFKNVCQPGICGMEFIVVLICFCLISNEVGIFSLSLYKFSFFVKVYEALGFPLPVHVFDSFFYWVVFVGLLYVVKILAFCQLYVLYMSFPNMWLITFHPFNGGIGWIKKN